MTSDKQGVYTDSMQVNVLFFGLAHDLAGVAQAPVEVTDGERLGDLWRKCEARFPRLSEIGSSLVAAVNQEIADPSHPLRDGDEVAFLPPVSGGAGDDHPEISDFRFEISNLKFEISGSYFCRLTRERIPTEELANQLKAAQDGAVVVFEGIVRDHSKGKATLYLDYEAYEPMALRKMEEIAREVKDRFPIDRVGMVHRLGRLEIGETSVAIIVTSAHRGAAFEACHWAIDRLKQVVPIWKKEYFEDGAVWAEGAGLREEARSQKSEVRS